MKLIRIYTRRIFIHKSSNTLANEIPANALESTVAGEARRSMAGKTATLGFSIRSRSRAGFMRSYVRTFHRPANYGRLIGSRRKKHGSRESLSLSRLSSSWSSSRRRNSHLELRRRGGRQLYLVFASPDVHHNGSVGRLIQTFRKRRRSVVSR